MNARIASVREGLSLRQIVAFDVFRWSVRFGLAVAPRDVGEVRRQRQRRRLRQAVPAYLREDVGLPPDDTSSVMDLAIRSFLTR